MRFWQRYQFNEYEHPFGIQNVLFVVSDDYNQLFQPIPATDTETDIKTDIFQLESVKKDLNTEEGRYAIDELPFSVNHLACQSENDLKAMYFVLDAANIKVNRYCAVFFGEEPTLQNMLFIGKIGSKISGNDKYWEGGDYEFNVNPKREYKLSAYSFDVSILEQVKLTGKIESVEGMPIQNVYERFEAEEWDSVKNIFQYRFSYARANINFPYVYICPLGNLYKVIKLYLDKASEIINELINTNITLNLVESSLGIQTLPVSFILTDNKSDMAIKGCRFFQAEKLELRLADADYGGDWSAPFIHRKLIDPALGNSQEYDWQKNQISSELPYSFKNLDNVSDLLFEIARSFACYLFISYTSGTSINIEFKSRKSLIESDYTYIRGVKEASIDTSSIITKEANEFYGLANNFAVDEYDEIINKLNTNEPQPSQKFEDLDRKRKYDKEKKGIEYKRLLLTTSLTIHTVKAGYDNDFVTRSLPINVTIDNSGWNDYELYSSSYSYTGDRSVRQSSTTERIHTGIYVKADYVEEDQKGILRDLGKSIPPYVWRPALVIFSKINDVNMFFSSLTKYVNYILARDKQYYETEYTLTVPFWNGFSKNPDGSNPSWKNIKLGSKVKLAETVKRYNPSTNTWTEKQVQRDYVVVGIEINLQKPETKLKLHSLERFAFGWWDGGEDLLSSFIYTINQPESFAGDDIVVKSYEIETGEEILAGDAVMLLNTGKIAKSKSLSDYQSKTIGIARESGSSGEKILVQISGRVYFDGYSFANIGGQVFVRTNDTGTNISENILSSPTYTEDMIICLGKIDSEKSFILNIMEFPFESGVLQS